MSLENSQVGVNSKPNELMKELKSNNMLGQDVI